MKEKLEWAKPKLESLGAASLDIAYGACGPGTANTICNPGTTASDGCTTGHITNLSCVSGDTAGSGALCTYGGNVF